MSSASGSPVSITAVSWSASESLDFAEWIGYGRRLGLMSRGAQWWIGDWLRFGNIQYRGRYMNASKVTGYDTQTLMNLSYVAARIEVSRRREKLSWSHHAEVAALPPEEQDRWLEFAESERLSVRSLRAHLRFRASHAQSEPTSGDSEGEVLCPRCGHRFAALPEGASHAGGERLGRERRPALVSVS